MAVREHDRLDVLGALAQVGEVGQHEVDAEHLGRREAQADVDDDDAAVVLDDGHVLADLAEPAERKDAQRAGAHARGAVASRPWRSSIAADARPALLVAPRRAAAAAPPTSKPSMLQRRLRCSVGLAVMNSVA